MLALVHVLGLSYTFLVKQKRGVKREFSIFHPIKELET